MRISDWSSDVCSSDLHSVADLDAHHVTHPLLVRIVHRPAIMTVGQQALVDDLDRGLGPEPFAHRRLGRVGESSEERRVGKEWVSTCRSRWSPLTEKKIKHVEKNLSTKEDKRQP